MLIVNPIYDTIFKFLLEDLKIVKLILSTLMGTKAISYPEVVEIMIVEDEITGQLEELYELKEIQKVVENQKRNLEEKEFELLQAELREKQAEKDKEKAEDDKKQSESLLLNSITGMIKMGVELEQIAKILNIEIVDLKELLTKIK